MAENGTRIRALFGPVFATLHAAVKSEPCGSLATRKVGENSKLLAKGEINFAQASDYLNQLREMTHMYGGEQCSNIVARAESVLKASMLARR